MFSLDAVAGLVCVEEGRAQATKERGDQTQTISRYIIHKQHPHWPDRVPDEGDKGEDKRSLRVSITVVSDLDPDTSLSNGLFQYRRMRHQRNHHLPPIKMIQTTRDGCIILQVIRDLNHR